MRRQRGQFVAHQIGEYLLDALSHDGAALFADQRLVHSQIALHVLEHPQTEAQPLLAGGGRCCVLLLGQFYAQLIKSA